MSMYSLPPGFRSSDLCLMRNTKKIPAPVNLCKIAFVCAMAMVLVETKLAVVILDSRLMFAC